jgi:hypothetical protein
MKTSDELIGILILVAVLVFAAHAGGGAEATNPYPETTPTAANPTTVPPRTKEPHVRTTTPKAITNVPGGGLTSCPGWVIGHGTGGHDVEAVTLKVYYSPVAGGRNCAIAIKGGAVGRNSTIAVSLSFTSYSGTAWPRYAYYSTNRPAWRTRAVYLDDTNRRCIDASAIYRPSPGSKTRIVHVRKIGCR